MSKLLLSALFAVPLLGLAPLAAAAQDFPSELSCSFDQGTARADEDRAARRTSDEVSVTFTGIDAASGRATLVEDGRSISVVVMAAPHALTFVELLASGNVAMTTVSILTSGGDFPAVHSRHVFDSLSPGYLATQLYGSCLGRL